MGAYIKGRREYKLSPQLRPSFFKRLTLREFQPIAMADFKFQIILKILAHILAHIMPTITSKEHRGFLHGRQIRDCICLTYEAINLLHNKYFGYNLSLKIDISKDFDNLDLCFLQNVLKAFGFNASFCS